MENRMDLTFGTDKRGDDALFIDRSHINGWDVDSTVKDLIGDNLTFFRVIEDGEERSGHGWIEDGKIIQWG
jgi:hypothetical protein